MAQPDFQKLGLNRLAQNIARSVNEPVGALVTGDITKGKVVSIDYDGTTATGTAVVEARRTGAIPISADFAVITSFRWSIDGTILTAILSGATTGQILFWVF